MSNTQICFTIIFVLFFLFIVTDFYSHFKNEKRFKKIEEHIGLKQDKS